MLPCIKKVIKIAKVIRKQDESIEQLIKRFNKQVEKDGTLIEWKKREYYIAPSLKKKLKSEAAEKRRRKEERKLNKVKVNNGID